MNSKLVKRIQEMFRVSEIITVNEEAINPSIIRYTYRVIKEKLLS